MYLRLALLLSCLALFGCRENHHELDELILGRWKSNQELTLQTLQYPAEAQPEMIMKVQALFGRMVITYTRSKASALTPATEESPEWHEEVVYEVIERSDNSITLRFFDKITQDYKAEILHFEGPDRYWINLQQLNGREYFDRVKD